MLNSTHFNKIFSLLYVFVVHLLFFSSFLFALLFFLSSSDQPIFSLIIQYFWTLLLLFSYFRQSLPSAFHSLLERCVRSGTFKISFITLGV